jgi:hypothetical protein
LRVSWKERTTTNGLPVTVLHCSLICPFTSVSAATCAPWTERAE